MPTTRTSSETPVRSNCCCCCSFLNARLLSRTRICSDYEEELLVDMHGTLLLGHFRPVGSAMNTVNISGNNDVDWGKKIKGYLEVVAQNTAYMYILGASEIAIASDGKRV